jgi:hypothetical protein
MFFVRARPITIAPDLAPTARPAGGRWIDPRGQRFGAGASAVALVLAWLLGAWPLAALVGCSLGVSSALGTRWFLFGRPWPLVRRALRLGPSELEHEMPPRFAQALGSVLVLPGSLLLALRVSPWGWLPVAVVVALQVVLAVTGYCLGCRLFLLRWWIPDRFARVVGRGVSREALVIVEPPC